jgi:drug/metabolite transporter (DMT)-like permease
MFLGEALCLIVYYISVAWEKRKPETLSETSPLLSETQTNRILPMSGWNHLLLWIPTLCDMTATTLMNVGLIYISASIYQMLRGSVVLFTGTFSVLFLNRKHPWYRWFALFTVFVGVGLVGLSSAIQSGSTDSVPIKGSTVGVFMVVLAQVFTASQFVIEEKILCRYDVAPLKAVGLEGVFGLLSVGLALPILYFSIGIHGDHGSFFDLPVGWHQIISFPQVLYAGIGIIFSIAFFNWFGLSVTRSISATSRSTIDTCR